MHKKLGKFAEVSVLLKNVRPLHVIKEHFPNDYRTRRCRFIILSMDPRIVNDEEIYTLTLKFKDPRNDPLGDNDIIEGHPNIDWYTKINNVRLEKGGPPNQYFKAQFDRQNNVRRRADLGRELNPPNNERTENDPTTDSETEGISPPVVLNSQLDNSYVQWGEFEEEINFDNRAMNPKVGARMIGHETDMEFLTPFFFLRAFFPLSYLKNHIIAGTNKELVEYGKRKLTIGEFWVWQGLWVLMTSQPAYEYREFFSLRERTKYWNPSFVGDIMSRNRFEEINQHFSLRADDPPSTYRDKFWWIRELIVEWNRNMIDKFSPSWIVCVDESMVVFLNPYAPGWVTVKRKPHPMGNEYHTAACADTKILYCVEIVEGKDQPTEGPHSSKEFEGQMDSNVAALVARMCKCIQGSARVVVLDSGFGYVPTVVELLKMGLYSTCVVKKKKGWPKYTHCDEVLSEIHGKDVGSIIVRKGTAVDGGYPFFLAAQADSKHTSIMLSSWATTRRDGKMRRRRVGGELVEFKYGEYQRWYYYARHAVDDNNNNRQGCLSYEERFCPRDWSTRQFGFLFAVSLTNALLAYNHFVLMKNNKKKIAKSDFLCKIAEEMINNEDYAAEIRQEEQRNKRRSTRRQVGHQLCTMVPYSGKWDGEKFRPTRSQYQKYVCSFKCKRMVRTYCSCDPTLILCKNCFAIHFAEHNSTAA